MSTDLREELDALARTQTFSPDPSAWDRGRRARRRTRLAAGLAAVAVVAVVAGAGALALPPDREARTASSEVVEGGAIPSRIEDSRPTSWPRPTSRSGAGRRPYLDLAAGTPWWSRRPTGWRTGSTSRAGARTARRWPSSPDGLWLAWQQTGRRWPTTSGCWS